MELRFVNSKKEADDAVSFVFQPEKTLRWIAGQYMDFEIPHQNPDSRGTHRWFSIASAPCEDFVMITTRISPKGSSFKRTLMNLQPGEIIKCGAPRGNFVLKDSKLHYILIAGGIGITPFRSILTQTVHEKTDMQADLLYLNKNEAYFFDKHLNSLTQKNNKFNIYKFTDRRLRIDDLEGFIKDDNTIFYISGPRPMVESYEQLLLPLTGQEKILTDYFPGY